MNVPPQTIKTLLATIARRLTPQPIKLRADIELTCFQPAGIDAIKKALKAGEAVSTPTVPIKAKLVAPPFYVLGTNATDKVSQVGDTASDVVLSIMHHFLQHAGVEKLEQAIEVIRATIAEEGGELNVRMKVGTFRFFLIVRAPVRSPSTPFSFAARAQLTAAGVSTGQGGVRDGRFGARSLDGAGGAGECRGFWGRGGDGRRRMIRDVTCYRYCSCHASHVRSQPVVTCYLWQPIEILVAKYGPNKESARGPGVAMLLVLPTDVLCCPARPPCSSPVLDNDDDDDDYASLCHP